MLATCLATVFRVAAGNAALEALLTGVTLELIFVWAAVLVCKQAVMNTSAPPVEAYQ